MLSGPPPKLVDVSCIPILHCLVLDPWLEPLPSPGPEPFTDQPCEVRRPELMVVDAEGFILWKDHFKCIEGMVPAWSGSVLVTLGTHLVIWFTEE